MTAGSEHDRFGTRSEAIRRLLGDAGIWLVLASLIDIGVGVLFGSSVWWLGWKRAPIKDFFVALAGIGGALLIAYSVTVSQVLPMLGKNAVRGEEAHFSIPAFGRIFGSALGVAMAAVVGLSACLALVRDPLEHTQWLAMALFGVSIITLGVLALAVGLGTTLYVFQFFEE